MKRRISLVTTSAIILTSLITAHADPLINLDFEQVGASPPSNDIKDLLPGWSLSYNTQSIFNIGYNTLYSDYGAVGIISRDAFPALHLDSPWPSGDHFLYFDFYPSNGAYKLTQRGDIPENAVQFNVHTIAEWDLSYQLYPKFSGVYSVSFNGVNIDPFTRDISMFSGQKDVELSIMIEPSAYNYDGMGISSFIDGFSITVPEPATWILISLGGIGLFCHSLSNRTAPTRSE